MGRLEADCGLPVQSFPAPADASTEAYYQRLLTLGQHLLTQMEKFYQRFYGGPGLPLRVP
ncbi:MAG: hypothetical protein HC929_10295, partial [Leptolyngbyaceae cyanobacterium SM2_5_2]|nr:hypothetical protein [Leptolyngbyaceae cyanobacterium SM2_5_2]